MNRRDFVSSASLLGAALGAPALRAVAAEPPHSGATNLTSLTRNVAPITRAEYAARISKLQGLMRGQGLSAVLVEPGASLVYFTGVQWWRSERLTAAVIPAEGQSGIVCPFFEEPSIRETLKIDAEVRTWQEDEDPLAVVAGLLRDRKKTDAIGIEETVRYFVIDALARQLPHAAIKSAAGAVRGCRMIKSPAELALMKAASDVTIAAYRHTIPRVTRGMQRDEIASLMNEATLALGGADPWSLILLNEASAYPHGSKKPQVVQDRGIVLMDCGCAVEGYSSDISRTFVFGEPTARQREVWNRVREGQRIALAAAKVGAQAGSVDDAVRRQYEKWGYGPNYRLPGLSHRTGHGIGLDGHEPINLVHGETGTLQPGMCFSNEPGLYIPGEFGVRLEDCFHMTASGPQWFSEPSESIEHPMGTAS
jgi:Xaa-Pro aminopeptidase